MIDDLYSQKVLSLAANMPRVGRLPAPHGTAEKVAKLCGSRVVVDVAVEGDRVADFAQDVKACALGQASASVLGAHVMGASLAEIELARDQLVRASSLVVTQFGETPAISTPPGSSSPPDRRSAGPPIPTGALLVSIYRCIPPPG